MFYNIKFCFVTLFYIFLQLSNVLPIIRGMDNNIY